LVFGAAVGGDGHEPQTTNDEPAQGAAMTRKAFGMAMLVALALAITPAISLAHHAFSAEFDQSKPVKVQGSISRLEWTNPHAWIFIDSKGTDGKVVTWRFEMGAPNALLRAGWSKTDIKPGTEVTISGFLARAGGSVGNAYQVRLADGRDLFAASSLKDAADSK
jgi:hypothetical protein